MADKGPTPRQSAVQALDDIEHYKDTGCRHPGCPVHSDFLILYRAVCRILMGRSYAPKEQTCIDPDHTHNGTDAYWRLAYLRLTGTFEFNSVEMTPTEHFVKHGAACQCGASTELLFSTPEERGALLDRVMPGWRGDLGES